jgi:hypothetical protein
LVLKPLKTITALLAPAVLTVAGCGGRVSSFNTDSSQNISIHAAATRIDTGGSTRFSATTADGEPAKVEWVLSGGDPTAGAGTIQADGLYTPPGYLTRDAVSVEVSAVPVGKEPAQVGDISELTVVPAFLQPLTPGNLTLGPNGSVTVSGSMTEVGGTAGIHFALASDAAGTTSNAGSLSEPHCVRGSVEGPNPAYTVCSVTYTAPASVPASGSVFVVGSIASSPASHGSPLSWTRIQLNAQGISSNPAAHQAHLAVPVQLGSSTGNNSDYDASLGQLSDCCGGTLGALLQDTSGNQYVLSNNHVLARSDQSIPGETIIQPGLIDNGCTPYGVGPGTTPVATLTGYPALSSAATNVDAAIARVTPGLVDPRGTILELGAKQQDGTLAAAPPGISSSGGKGETASLGMMVAKSGRTTGLTCAAVSAISVDVTVDYFSDCAETAHSMTKTFTNQFAIAGTSFSDAGDSGALVVDSANAEPVGLFYAGGTDEHGVELAIANPVGDVLSELNSQVAGSNGQTEFSFVGGADHAVSCLTYSGSSNANESAALATLPTGERERAEAALPLAELLVNPTLGIARVGVVAGKDHAGSAAIAFYIDTNPAKQTALLAAIPPFVNGVPTAIFAASELNADPSNLPTQPRSGSLTLALAAKQRNAAALMKSNPAIFGVGVGQSLDNPGDAVVMLFVDRRKVAGKLPEAIDGQRVRVILMDRLHVTRSHGTPVRAAGSCSSSRPVKAALEDGTEPLPQILPREDSLQLPE